MKSWWFKKLLWQNSMQKHFYIKKRGYENIIHFWQHEYRRLAPSAVKHRFMFSKVGYLRISPLLPFFAFFLCDNFYTRKLALRAPCPAFAGRFLVSIAEKTNACFADACFFFAITISQFRLLCYTYFKKIPIRKK